MRIEIFSSFVITFIISVLFVPIVSKVSKKLGIIAHVNQRTVHKGVIARTGGYAIYAAFLIGAMIFLKTDTQINSILIGGFIVFMTGLYDDIHDISPKFKLAGQLVAALVVIFYGGISLKGFTLPFLPETISYVIAIIVTIVWIVGICNAVNLIDGLDGLCGGISIIVLVTISITSLTYGRTDITSLSLMLAGAIAGFLIYNFHPAKIFLGDCGALFIGYMIAVISLLGFGYKSSSFFTLGAPIVVLMVPIMDTFIAIVRRKVNHKKMSEADRNHLHHKLMFSLELGQRKSVLILYIVTILFSVCSYIYVYDKLLATLLFCVLMIFFEIFIEATNMIGRKYKPLLTIANIFIQSDYLPHIKDSKTYQKIRSKMKLKYVLVFVTVIFLLSTMMIMSQKEEIKPPTPSIVIVYEELSNPTTYMNNIYNQLKVANTRNNKESLRSLVAMYFATDYYTLSNKTDVTIGGVPYLLEDKREDFVNYALEGYYSQIESVIAEGKNTQEVTRIRVLSNDVSTKAISGLEDYTYYDVVMNITFNEFNEKLDSTTLTTTVTIIEKDQKYSVIAVDE